jgi:glycosyltransferase involved in cell wall biosynthesis
MKKPPLISVVIPTYNRVSCILPCIDSVIQQTYRHFELIIVDDGSTDGTLKLLESLTDPRIQIIRNKENRGANAARNTGIQRAKGVFLAFQDSDDVWTRDKLSRQLDACAHSGALACFCSLDRSQIGYRATIPKKGMGLKAERSDLSRRILFGNFLSTQTLLVHRNCFRSNTFDETLPRLQDWELCIRLTQKVDFHYVDASLVTAGMGSARISSGFDSYYHSMRQVVEKHHTLFSRNPAALAAVKLNCVAVALAQGRFKIAARETTATLLACRLSLLAGLAELLKRRLG